MLPSALDAQFGAPYPRSAGFDTDTSASLSVGPNWGTYGASSGNLRAGFTRSLTYPVCLENEIRANPIGIVDTSGGFAGLVLPLSKCVVTGIPSLIGSS